MGSYTNDGGFAVMGGDSDRVVVVDCRTPYKRGDGWKTACAERDANARAISAVPELIEAAQLALGGNALLDGGEFIAIPRAGYDALIAALAKALGTQSMENDNGCL
jgi:hypothetical protein